MAYFLELIPSRGAKMTNAEKLAYHHRQALQEGSARLIIEVMSTLGDNKYSEAV